MDFNDNVGILGIEYSVLATIFFDEKKFDEVAQHIGEDDFIYTLNSLVFRAMKKCSQDNIPISQDKIYNMICKDPCFNESEYLYLLSKTPISNIEYYAGMIKDYSNKRKILSLCTELSDLSNTDTESKVILEKAEQGLYGLMMKQAPIQDYSSQIDKTIELYLESKKINGELKGLDTGFSKLNSITTGFNSGELIIIGARPSMGKTALALNIVQSILNQGNAVAFFSLEMPAYQLINRLASSYCSIGLKKIRAGTTTEQEEELLLQTFQKLKNLNLVIDDSATMGIFELKSKVRFLKRKNPQLKCVVIDYLQLMNGTQVKDRPRHEEIAEISRGLKAIARELEITLIALSQINRNIESREDKRPNLGDLRESGSIEQDADVIIFLYRDDVYARKELLAKKKKEEKEGKFDHSLLDIEEKPIETAELIVAKNRNGATTTIFTQFNKQFTRFEEGAKHQEIKKTQGTMVDFAL